MGQRYPYSKRREKNIVVVLHIYEARAIFLLFFDNKDIKYEWCEIERSIYKPILTH